MTRQTKEIEKTIKETVTMFIASDGTEFTSEEQCKTYEESAIYALKIRLAEVMKKVDRTIVINKGIDAIVDDWRSEADYWTIKFENDSQIKDFIAYQKAENFYCGNNTEWSEKEENAEKVACWYPEKFGDLKVGVSYLYLERDDWSVIISKEKFLKCFENGWNAIFN